MTHRLHISRAKRLRSLHLSFYRSFRPSKSTLFDIPTPHATFDSSGARATHSDQTAVKLPFPTKLPMAPFRELQLYRLAFPLAHLVNRGNIMKIHPTPGASPRWHISKLPCRFPLSQPVVFASSRCSRFPSRICRS